MGESENKRNFYSVLGIAGNATQEEIKIAYRKLSVQFHPDFNPGNNEASLRFQEADEAYKTLSDARKRKQYDSRSGVEIQFGMKSVVHNFFKSVFNVR